MFLHRSGNALAVLVAAASVTLTASANSNDGAIISANLDKACAFTGSGTINVTIPGTTTGIYPIGNLGFSCNFAGTANVSMLATGGTFLVNGAIKRRYAVRWRVPPEQPWLTSPVTVTYTWPIETSSTPNAVRNELLEVDLIEPLIVAGNYNDTLVFNIAP